ncbi:MAG: ABC transporter permease [Anaerolineae bacterium]|nr:ABC transporter permease [Anaerolineae bacterium]MDQ7037318.1 ABC transporter permease [Anaerolineae bacterium]
MSIRKRPNIFRGINVERLLDLIPILIALFAAFIVASFLLIALDANPITAFSAMFEGAFGSQNATAETLVKATPILFVAIGITIAFRGGVINIGGEGQMIAGALGAITVTLMIGESLNWLVIPLALFAGFIAGGIYGGIAGFLKAYFDVNEILSTIMLNQIAVQLMNFLLNGPLLDPESGGFNNIPKTARISEVAQLPRLAIFDFFSRTRLHYGLIIAIIIAIIIYVLLWRTTIGYRIRAVGLNQRASRYAGINVERQIVLSMFLAGGMAGLAGAVQVLGLNYRLQTDGSPAGFTANAGFNGIVAALFGGLNPLGAIPASTFFGALLVGAQKMQREVGVPASMITAINGLIVVFVVSSQIFILRRTRRRVGEAIGQMDDNHTEKLKEGEN